MPATVTAAQTGSLVARAHGIGARALATWVGAWVLVVLANHLTLPPIDPDPAEMRRPMETVTTLMTAVPAGLSALVAHTPLAWLHCPRRRRPPVAEATLAGVILMAQAGAAWVATSVVPGYGLVPSNVLGLTLALTALALLVARLAGPRPATVAPGLTVAVFAVGALVPWEVNVVFNTDLAGWLLRGSLVLALLAVVVAGVTAARVRSGPEAAEHP